MLTKVLTECISSISSEGIEYKFITKEPWLDGRDLLWESFHSATLHKRKVIKKRKKSDNKGSILWGLHWVYILFFLVFISDLFVKPSFFLWAFSTVYSYQVFFLKENSDWFQFYHRHNVYTLLENNILCSDSWISTITTKFTILNIWLIY